MADDVWNVETCSENWKALLCFKDKFFIVLICAINVHTALIDVINNCFSYHDSSNRRYIVNFLQ